MRYLTIVLAFTLASSAIFAQSLKVDTEKTVLAVLTHKAGLGSGLAHNHFIMADNYTATVSYDRKDINNSKCDFDIPVKDLSVDPFEISTKWLPTLQDLGIYTKKEKFNKLSDSDQKEIYNNMIASGQLDSQNYPKIQAKIQWIQDGKPFKIGSTTFNKSIKIALTVHGKTVYRALPANAFYKDGVLEIELVGKFKFSEFDITPYSAFFGAVKNQDVFHLYAKIYAK